MTSYLIDINVWLALSWGSHPASAAAHRWLALEPEKKTKLIFCRITQLGLLRLLTNEMVMGADAMDVGRAFEVFDLWMADPRVELGGEPLGLEAAFRQASSGVAGRKATKTLMDAYLIAFAGVEKAILVSFDKGMAKLALQAGVEYRLLKLD